jgi:hypothetical protein
VEPVVVQLVDLVENHLGHQCLLRVGVAAQVGCLAGRARCAGGKAQRPAPGPGGEDSRDRDAGMVSP